MAVGVDVFRTHAEGARVKEPAVPVQAAAARDMGRETERRKTERRGTEHECVYIWRMLMLTMCLSKSIWILTQDQSTAYLSLSLHHIHHFLPPQHHRHDDNEQTYISASLVDAKPKRSF